MKKFKKEIMASEIAIRMGWSLKGLDKYILSVASVDDAREDSITFSQKGIKELCPGYLLAKSVSGNGFEVSNPRLSFARLLSFLISAGYLDCRGERHDVHSSVTFGNNVLVENGVVIGENTHISDNAIIRSNVVIGKDCRIGANSIIGGQGFGYERDQSGIPIHIPHVGGVVIGNNVDIGALTTVISGTIAPTRIGNHTKIDDHVHFGHNCHVGESSILTACSEFSGGVRLGNKVWVGPNVSIREKIKVSDHAFIGIGSVVIADVHESEVIVGNPGRPIRQG